MTWPCDFSVARNALRVKRLESDKIPRAVRGIFISTIYRSSRIRMIRGIGIPTSQRRMGIGCSFVVAD
jgi:hypothetical protein